MHTRIFRWALGAALSIAVSAGGAIFGPMPAHAQSITGLGQADQQFNRCRFPTIDDDRTCSDHDHSHEGGGKGRSSITPSPR
jgi:hypothetical protein